MYRTKALGCAISRTLKTVIDNNLIHSRTLFSAPSLGLDTFLNSRERTKLQIPSIEKFKAKMAEFVKDENAKNLIFTEDLKNMVHISTAEDCELIAEMVKRFCTQSREVRFGNFVFGPVIMRLFYHLQDSKTALQLFLDESLGGFFDQLITYQILLDLLYTKEQYQDILDTFDVIRARQLQGSRYPKHSIILVFAACYKLNTPESFEYAKKVWHGAIEAGHNPLRRAATFLAYSALKQNNPQVSLEILGNVKGQNYISVRAIKVLALTKLKRFEDVVPILRSLLEGANPLLKKQTIPIDVIEKIQQEFKENNKDKDLQVDFDKVVAFLTNHDHITNETLEDILCSQININVNSDGMPFNQQKRHYQQTHEGSARRVYGGNPRQAELDRPSRFYARRPGLHELN